MRTPYTCLVIACLTTATASAQTMDNGNGSPVPGESFTMTQSDYADPGASGSGVTWDFSTLTSGATTTVNMVTPASTPNGASFPGSTVAQDIGDGNVAYFQGSAAGFDLMGIYTSIISQTIVYANTERILAYPCSFGTTWTDPFQSNFTSLGFPVARAGTISGNADGYGTLVMPYGTVTNVLRVRTIEDYSDDVQGLYTVNYDFVNHYYYKPGTHAPLLAIYDQDTDIAGEVTTNQYASWITTGPAGIDEAMRNAIGIDIFPNPATEQAAIVFSSGGGTVQLELLNASGQVVRTTSHAGQAMGIGRIDLDVQGLDPGIYLLRLSTPNGEQGTARLMLQ